jgi:hypothetical protein
LQKCITCSNKSIKGCQEWNKACIEAGLRPKKLNTLVKTLLVMFLIILILFHFCKSFVSSCFVNPKSISAGLQINSHYFKRHCNSGQQLFFVVIDKLLLVVSSHP